MSYIILKKTVLGGGHYIIEDSNGDKEWWLNGKLHREDGPAIEYSNGYKAWCLNGTETTKQVVLFMLKRKRKLSFKYWLKWIDYVMNPTTERGRRYANRQYDKLYT